MDLRTFSDGRSGSSWQRRARKLPFSLHSVVFVVRNTVPPTFSFTHSSFEFILSLSSVLDWLEVVGFPVIGAPSLAAAPPELTAAGGVGDCPVAMFSLVCSSTGKSPPALSTSLAHCQSIDRAYHVRPLNSILNRALPQPAHKAINNRLQSCLIVSEKIIGKIDLALWPIHAQIACW